jgi:hypothetical protein
MLLYDIAAACRSTEMNFFTLFHDGLVAWRQPADPWENTGELNDSGYMLHWVITNCGISIAHLGSVGWSFQQQVSPLEQGKDISNWLLEVKVGWGKWTMMGDKNNESESNIPAARSTSLTASISARARNSNWILEVNVGWKKRDNDGWWE